jgi:hypothetical protein
MAIAESPRPYWAKVAMVVHSGTGMILDCKVGNLRQTMAEAAGQAWIGCIKKSGVRPKRVKVRSANLEQALQPLALALKTRLERVARLPELEMARRSLERDLPALP